MPLRLVTVSSQAISNQNRKESKEQTGSKTGPCGTGYLILTLLMTLAAPCPTETMMKQSKIDMKRQNDISARHAEDSFMIQVRTSARLSPREPKC